jgi:methylmalonyl-CoA mutase cobalamin-binding subunit
MLPVRAILGACLGNCVHVAGIQNFLSLAERLGWSASFVGPSQGVEAIVEEARRRRPDVLAVSYRLTPEVARDLFPRLASALAASGLGGQRLVFGGTPAVCAAAAESGIFEAVFSGEEPVEEVEAWLRGETATRARHRPPDKLRDRVDALAPYPLLRHHFGRPSVEETVEGGRIIAEAGVLDVLSIGTDQNAQEFFFDPERMNPMLSGGGGVPVRSPEHLRAIFDATRAGNYPLVRCYSGTNDLMKWAPILLETIDNCWGATPLTWYSELDGRSKRSLETAIRENREVAAWWASKGVAVEFNEPHQWGLREAHDAVFVVTGYLAALNAKDVGVRDYVMQMMFNTPRGMSPRADLAKMLAMASLVKPLEDRSFRVYRMTRAGLNSLPPDPQVAKGHLAASVAYQMMLRPQIVHVVGFSEADHAIRAEELVESCRIAHGAVRLALKGTTDPTSDGWVRARVELLEAEAKRLLEAIGTLGKEMALASPLTSQDALAAAIREGILDAPHFKDYKVGKGEVRTGIVEGCCEALDGSGRPLAEDARLARLGY